MTILQQEVGTPNPPTTLTVQSTILGEKRRIYIQLPEGYDHSRAWYPVLFVMDGGWLFEYARATVRFFSESDVTDIAIPKMIVVGIENTDRNRNYVPTMDPKHQSDYPNAGETDKFLKFLAQELVPLIDYQYLTVPNRTVIGWSFSGLFAMYSAVAMPELFDAYLCISPAIWWDNELVLKLFQQPLIASTICQKYTTESQQRCNNSSPHNVRYLQQNVKDHFSSIL